MSRSTWLGLLVTVTLWGVYGVTVSDWTITATNVPLVFVATSIVLAMVRDGAAEHRHLWLTGVGTLVAGLVVVALIGPAPVGAAAATVTVARILPQLTTAVQAADVAGVSITTWLGNVANKVPWAIYGFGVADLWMGTASVAAVVLSRAIVAVVVVRRRDAPVLAA